jgi:hypothetical protein
MGVRLLDEITRDAQVLRVAAATTAESPRRALECPPALFAGVRNRGGG